MENVRRPHAEALLRQLGTPDENLVDAFLSFANDCAVSTSMPLDELALNDRPDLVRSHLGEVALAMLRDYLDILEMTSLDSLGDRGLELLMDSLLNVRHEPRDWTIWAHVLELSVEEHAKERDRGTALELRDLVPRVAMLTRAQRHKALALARAEARRRYEAEALI